MPGLLSPPKINPAPFYSGTDCGAQNPEIVSLSPGTTINTFPVPDFNYVDDELVVLDRVNDAVWSLPDPVALRPG